MLKQLDKGIIFYSLIEKSKEYKLITRIKKGIIKSIISLQTKQMGDEIVNFLKKEDVSYYNVTKSISMMYFFPIHHLRYCFLSSEDLNKLPEDLKKVYDNLSKYNTIDVRDYKDLKDEVIFYIKLEDLSNTDLKELSKIKNKLKKYSDSILNLERKSQELLRILDNFLEKEDLKYISIEMFNILKKYNHD